MIEGALRTAEEMILLNENRIGQNKTLGKKRLEIVPPLKNKVFEGKKN